MEKAQEASCRDVLVNIDIVASCEVCILPAVQGGLDTAAEALRRLHLLARTVIARLVVWREVGDATHEGAREGRQVAASHLVCVPAPPATDL